MDFILVNADFEKVMVAENEAQIIAVALGVAKKLKKKMSSWTDENGFICLDFGAFNSYIKYKI